MAADCECLRDECHSEVDAAGARRTDGVSPYLQESWGRGSVAYLYGSQFVVRRVWRGSTGRVPHAFLARVLRECMFEGVASESWRGGSKGECTSVTVQWEEVKRETRQEGERCVV